VRGNRGSEGETAASANQTDVTDAASVAYAVGILSRPGTDGLHDSSLELYSHQVEASRGTVDRFDGPGATASSSSFRQLLP
jgi:hypothetical protein